MGRLRLGIAAFREAYLTSPVTATVDWSAQDARALRYAILWAQYEQTSYRDAHSWATAYRKQYALYKYVRPVYNPAYRLGEFWKAHLFGGLLDLVAGDNGATSQAVTGAIPIVTDSDALKVAIVNLWQWSRWQVQKDILTVRGAILGDAAIRVVDDIVRGRAYLELLHPGTIEYVEKDPFGNVKGYGLRENRDDPRGKAGTVTYSEVVSRNGDFVVYETFLNGKPYAWPDNTDKTGLSVASWSEPYTFVPLVVIQHNDVGLDWGWSELHPIRAKVQEADDLASMLSDQVRKTIDPIWLMKGMKQTTLTLTGATSTTDRPYPGREELQAVWDVPIEGGAEAMVAELDLESVLRHIDTILKEIERDVVELSQDIHTASGDASGRALRVARQPIVAKVVQRRANYDAGMVAAHQMAIAIGGWRGYEGYQGFGLDSYAKGDLDHTIADRPVFEEDALDSIEIDTAFWKAAEQAGKAGVSLASYLREAGWDEERIALIEIETEQPVVEPRSKPGIGEDVTDD